MQKLPQNHTAEWAFRSSTAYQDPFNEIELSVAFTAANGTEQLVPAFWDGGRTWRVRFASPQVGRYQFRTVCSDPANAGLHGQSGEWEVTAYKGAHPLYRHGPVRVAANGRHFEHVDGTPFFWLGDTWWMGLCKRLSWPTGFQTLARDRVKKGFNVIHIVAGLYPDMPAFDKRGANERGYPWEKKYARINPAYFRMADRRIQHLVESGLVPCLVGCWGYFLPWLGVAKMKQHWRNLIARYGSYPVLWCAAGEGSMPYYRSTNWDADVKLQKEGWTEVMADLRQIDPYHRPLTIHPSSSARETVADPAVLDFDMLQTGHGDRSSLPNTVKVVSQSYRTTPVMPVVQGEVCYEGIGGFCGQEMQRWMFWASVLSGATGFTYGANGLWQLNSKAKPYGPSPHGMNWGTLPWDEACRLPGSQQLGLAKRFLGRYAWWRLEPHPEWVEGRWTDELFGLPFTSGRHDVPLAAGIPGELRLIYVPLGAGWKSVRELEPGARYRVRLFNPITGDEADRGKIQPDAHGTWKVDFPGFPAWWPFPIYQDWVVALERVDD